MIFLPMWYNSPANSVRQLQRSHCPVTGAVHLGVIPWDGTEDLPNPAAHKLPSLCVTLTQKEQG